MRISRLETWLRIFGADAVADKALAGGVIDILVNNAGYYHHLNWTTTTPEKWMETYQVNVLSGVRMIQRLAPAMRQRGMGSRDSNWRRFGPTASSAATRL
jgi:NAD(P)-dependent dehydrogenase (short-subunit alcohol dehydrogenase family)